MERTKGFRDKGKAKEKNVPQPSVLFPGPASTGGRDFRRKPGRELKGCVCAAEKNKLPIYEYSPLEIKVAVTGYGKSDKDQVTDMVKRLIRIEKEDVLDDEYDAIAVGLTCLAMERF